jgi:ABC-type polysaccharide/polyol phosphate transport system ATPase subunit
MGRPVIELDGVGKRYRLGEHHGTGTDLRETIARAANRLRRRDRPDVREIWSLRDVSFSVDEGQALGIIGSNGAGKSTLLKVINGITTPTVGHSRTRGRIGSLLEVGTGFHAELTGLENTYLNGAILGMSRREVARRLDEIVAFSGLEKFMDTPVKRYSSGMYLRLGFAVAAHMEADILLVDEVLAVGDAEFQRRCLGKMDEVEKSGRTVVFVSHNLDAMARLCPRAIWLDSGTVREAGPTEKVVEQYLRSGRGEVAARSFVDRPELPAQVRAVALVDGDGGEVTTLGLHSTAALQIELELRSAIVGLDVSWTVTNDQGLALVDEALRDGEAPAFDRPGRYRLRCHLPAVLTPGRYHVSVWLGTSYDDFEHHEHVVTFTVDGDDGGRPRRVRLGLTWEFTGPTADLSC